MNQSSDIASPMSQQQQQQESFSSIHPQAVPPVFQDDQHPLPEAPHQDQQLSQPSSDSQDHNNSPHVITGGCPPSSLLDPIPLQWYETICPDHRSIEIATHAFPTLDPDAFALDNPRYLIHDHPSVRLSQPLRFRLGLNNMPIEPILRCLSPEQLSEKEFVFRQDRLNLIARAMSFIRIQFKMAIARFDTTVRSHFEWLEKLIQALHSTNASLGVTNIVSFKDCIHHAIGYLFSPLLSFIELTIHTQTISRNHPLHRIHNQEMLLVCCLAWACSSLEQRTAMNEVPTSHQDRFFESESVFLLLNRGITTQCNTELTHIWINRQNIVGECDFFRSVLVLDGRYDNMRMSYLSPMSSDFDSPPRLIPARGYHHHFFTQINHSTINQSANHSYAFTYSASSC
jgi:hypothetical protein